MDHTYWLKQTTAEPLYPELIWDKPENKLHSGKLLIIGGSSHSFASIAKAYQTANEVGAGSVKILLPDTLKKSVGPVLESGEYAPSTKSGSFSKQALSSWLDFSAWADGVLLPGDLGRNSETAIVVEQFLSHYKGITTITKDALDSLIADAVKVLQRDNTVAVTSFGQLQKMALSARFTKAFTYSMTITSMVEALHLLSTIYPCAIIVKHNQIFYVAKDGEVSTTKTDSSEESWRLTTATAASVWALQNPSKIFAALTTAVI